MKKQPRISTYFLLAVFLVTLVTSGFYIYIRGREVVGQQKQLVSERDKLFAHTLAQSILIYVKNNTNDVEQLAGLAKLYPFKADILAPIVRNHVVNNRSFFAMSIIGKDGKVLTGYFPGGKTDAERDLTGIDVNDRDYYKEIIASRKTVISDAITARVAGAPPTVAIAAPIFDANKNLIGVAAGGLTLDALYRLAEAALGSEFAIPVVIDKQGQVIVHSDVKLIAQHKLLADFEPAKRALKGKEGFLDAFDDVDGKKRSAAYAPIPELGWGVWIAQDAGQFAEAQNRVAVASILWFLSTLVGISVLFLFISKALFQPFSKVADEAIDIVEKSDYGKKLEVPGAWHSHEVTALTETFNVLIDKVRLAFEEQKQSLKVKTQFLTVATHAFRTPLTVLRWTLSSIIEDAGSYTDEQNEQFKVLYDGTQRLILGFDNLFTAFEIEEKSARAEFKESDLVAIVEGSIKRLEPLARNSGITIRSQVQTGLKIAGDDDKIRRVVDNLLSNAIFYNRLKDGTVDVRLDHEDGTILLKVEDTGIGIPQAEKEHLFEAFFRGKNAAKKFTDGTGLGLFIAKAFVELHRGSIDIVSREGEGTTVLVRLPVQVSLMNE